MFTVGNSQKIRSFLPNDELHLLSDSLLQSPVQPLSLALSDYEKLVRNSPDSAANSSFFNKNLVDFKGNHFRFITNPLITNVFKIGGNQSKSLIDSELGVHTILTAGKHTSLQAYYSYNLSRFPSFASGKIDSLAYIPHHGAFTKRGGTYHWHNLRANLFISPVDFLDIQAGIGKNRYGNGYRSLFLSSNAQTYPYIKTDVHVWKINYSYLLAWLKDIHEYAPPFDRKSKFAVFHFLNWNITQRISIQLFETVIWAPDDSTVHRGMDMNYLNPVIFFRPVEFSTGSPDNVLMGLGMKIRLFNNVYTYGQFALDEFNLGLVKERNGWWGVKYGYQAGIMLPRFCNVPGLFTRIEINTVRPFTYSHSFTAKSYGHYIQPLAHPLGSNFMEILNHTKFRKNRFILQNKFFLHEYGIEDPGLNFGNDIYKSNNERARDYNNVLLQPQAVQLLINDFSADYILHPLWNLRLTGGIFTRTALQSEKPPALYFYLGLRTGLSQRNFWDGRYN